VQVVNTARGPLWSTTLPPEASSVPAARHFTVAALEALGGGDVTSPADLLVSELATNALVHAHTPMRVSVWCHDGRVRVEVRDDDPRLPRRINPDAMALGGRGMMLVDTIAAAWGVNANPRGKTVWFELAA
jgi:anti-sigma regulatory factor (Ser/Thr protein kinase)